jgi:hypothetical protein
MGSALPLDAQQGQGAVASAPEAVVFLRAGVLSKPGEPVEMLSTLPLTFPKNLLADGATVEAAAVSASTTVVVSRLKPDTPFRVADFRWKLLQNGWIANGPTPAGFVQSGGMGGPAIAVCKSGQFVTMQVRAASNGDRLLRTAIAADSDRGCAPLGMQSFNDIPMPRFELPPGVVSTSGGGGGSSTEQYQDSRLRTTLTREALVKTFTEQLVAEGWKVEGQLASDGTMTVERLSTSSQVGEPITGILILTTLGENSVDAYFRVVRNKSIR